MRGALHSNSPTTLPGMFDAAPRGTERDARPTTLPVPTSISSASNR